MLHLICGVAFDTGGRGLTIRPAITVCRFCVGRLLEDGDTLYTLSSTAVVGRSTVSGFEVMDQLPLSQRTMLLSHLRRSQNEDGEGEEEQVV